MTTEDFTFIDRDPFPDSSIQESKPKKRKKRITKPIPLPPASRLEFRKKPMKIAPSNKKLRELGRFVTSLYYSVRCPRDKCDYWTGFYVSKEIAVLTLGNHVKWGHESDYWERAEQKRRRRNARSKQ